MKQIEPTKQNSRILSEALQSQMKKAMKVRYPKVDDILGDLEKNKKPLFK